MEESDASGPSPPDIARARFEVTSSHGSGQGTALLVGKGHDIVGGETRRVQALPALPSILAGMNSADGEKRAGMVDEEDGRRY